MKIDRGRIGCRDSYIGIPGIRLLDRRAFISGLEASLRGGIPFAAARVGVSELFWMYYPVLLDRQPGSATLRVFERHLRFHGYLQAGIFPADPGFYLEFNRVFLEWIRGIDCLGMILDPVMGPEILRFHRLRGSILDFRDFIPDRSVPANPGNCYLHLFRGRKLLLVCPFARLLADRARRPTFEGVWAKIGKKWFDPARVEAVEFPYGFSREARERFATSFELIESVRREIAQRDFDVALIAAGGMTVPLVSFVRGMGRVAISLGGDLQVLFGVLGKRWRDKPRWRRDYINSWWIDMPPRYRPSEKDACGGAYW